ncbi:Aldehyde dehydrogenase, thermostable [Variovorax sp. PBS-H4]|uniref:aldehyde dehydrogenase family protein n=1 Tax=Variovorax sp. PBS-H4 TaxID=434008 RepID=UPI001319228A|nr:aldehyde dehydrogenase family protein [Variovorax sp. PBS-H4]VTU40761.1 Aldehyde dehydrogenase, thermostable [Variovorax sp. PBS-H4]
MTYTYGNLIGGSWRDTPAIFDTFNPARPAQQVGRYSLADSAMVVEAVRAATDAQRLWARWPAARRCDALALYIGALEARKEDLARAITAEQGKSLAESFGEVAKACAEGRFMLQHVMSGEGARHVTSLRAGVRNMVVRRPRGVIVAITPWNFPVMTPMRKIVPALGFGNAVIVKASEFTPAAACLLGELACDLLPDGLLQVIHGGADVGNALVSHSGVHGVTFTGSVATGKRIVAATAANLAEMSLELGGKNAAVIHDASDLDACLDQVANAALMCSGQRCTAVSRVLVQRDLHDVVAAGLAKRASAMRLGDGADPATQLGPMTHRGQLEHVKAAVRRAREDGAEVLAGGHEAHVEGCDGGYFFAPTVLDGVRAESAAAREEIFGPVISIVEYDTLDDAITILNDVEFGLTAAFFSNDAKAISRFVDECQTGMLHVNHGTVPDSHMPFGGIKASGVGAYSVGPSSAAFYTTEHSVYLGA